MNSLATVADLSDTFAGNRAAGRLALAVAAAGGATRRTRVYEDGPLRVRFPGARTGALEAVLVNTAGGIAGGDCLDLDIAAGPGADLTITSAAAEKVYRAAGAEAEIAVRLTAQAGAALAWLPQETILFDAARLARTIEVALADDAALLLAEAIVFGRTAMGETVRSGRLIDRWRVRRGGRLVFAETLRLEGAIADKLAQAAVLGGNVALATILLVPGGAPQVASVRALADSFAGEVAVSAWNGIAVVRLCAPDGARLRRDLTALLTALTGRPLPRLWLG